MDVYGEAREIGRTHLLRLAKEQDVSIGEATAAIAQACEVAGNFAAMAGDYPIRKATRQHLKCLIDGNVARVG
jgi:serine/threonine-protein kinase HipA